MAKGKKTEFQNREISWLSFNERVLQEAEDPSVPLLERVRFLGIYSNNLDEFYRVRVATLRRALGVSKKPIDPMDFDPSKTLQEIHQKVGEIQKRYEKCFQQLIAELKKNQIRLISENEIRREDLPFLTKYFEEQVRPALVPIMLSSKGQFPQMQDGNIYLAVKLSKGKVEKQISYSLIEISEKLNRFIQIPSVSSRVHKIIFIDDLIRYFLSRIYAPLDYDHYEAYCIKTTRDAELDVDEDISKSVLEKMTRSLHQRKKGQYVRINYDAQMPQPLLDFLLKRIKIRNIEYISAGGRYHNKKDLMHFPDFGKTELSYPAMPAIDHPDLKDHKGIMKAMQQKDILLHFPYHSFNCIIDLLREAATDPDVRTIRISLYRVAKNSNIINTLINAARNGKRVIAVVELQARFDEENNIRIVTALQEAGVRVIPGVQGLKVHSKLIQISRKEQGKTVRYVHIGTGNFHERTASVYSDFSLLTCRPEICSEVRRIFDFFENNFVRSVHRHLIVSPFGTRRKFTELINREIEWAEKKKSAWITLKMNNLVDASLIRKLYEASQSGVKIKLIIRGICSLVPGIPGQSENIEVISILGRYLEHSRIFVFGNNGTPEYFLSSADWMVRNIDHRIEVSTPILDQHIQKEIQEMLDIQTNEYTKVRMIDRELSNRYRKVQDRRRLKDAQMSTCDYLRKKSKGQ